MTFIVQLAEVYFNFTVTALNVNGNNVDADHDYDEDDDNDDDDDDDDDDSFCCSPFAGITFVVASIISLPYASVVACITKYKYKIS